MYSLPPFIVVVLFIFFFFVLQVERSNKITTEINNMTRTAMNYGHIICDWMEFHCDLFPPFWMCEWGSLRHSVNVYGISKIIIMRISQIMSISIDTLRLRSNSSIKHEEKNLHTNITFEFTFNELANQWELCLEIAFYSFGCVQVYLI